MRLMIYSRPDRINAFFHADSDFCPPPLGVSRDCQREKFSHCIQVLISSHILPDIEQTCSYVVILNKGGMAAEGQISELKEVQYSLYELKIKGEEKAFLDRLASMDSQVEQTADKLLKVYLSPGTDPQDIFKIAVEEKVQVRHFVKSQTSLEDLFAKVVGVD